MKWLTSEFALNFIKWSIQVEVNIDHSAMNIENSVVTGSWCKISEDKFIANFSIEAEIFDSGNWYTSSGQGNLLSTSIELTSSVDYHLGFIGYQLKGKLQMPKLWTAEQVKSYFT